MKHDISISELALKAKQKGLENQDILISIGSLLCLDKYKLKEKSLKNLQSPFNNIYENARLFAQFLNYTTTNLIDQLRTNNKDHFQLFCNLFRTLHIPQEQSPIILDIAYHLANYQGGTIYNPFAKKAQFGLRFNAGDNYYGEVSNEKDWCIGVISMLLKGGDAFSNNYVIGDSICKKQDKFDYIVLSPSLETFDSNSSFDYCDCISSLIKNSLKDNGTLILSTICLILYHKDYSRLREYLINNNLIDSIIILNSGILRETTLPPTIIKIRKGRNIEEPLKLFDSYTRPYFNLNAYKEGKDVLSIKPEQIKTKGFNLLPDLYLPEKTEENGLPVMKLKDIGEPIQCALVDISSGKVIEPSDLPDDPFKAKISPQHEISCSSHCLKLTQPALLISFIRQQVGMKVAYVEASETNPVYILNNSLYIKVFIFSFDISHFYYKYLALELSKAIVPHYTFHIFLNVQEILNTYIHYIPREEQIKIVDSLIQEEAWKSLVNISSGNKPILYLAQKEKTYNILICGDADPKCFENNNLKVHSKINVNKIEDIVNLLIIDEGKYDAVVIQKDSVKDEMWWLKDLYKEAENVFWITKNAEEFKHDFGGDPFLLIGHLFEPGDENTLAIEIRKVLDESNTSQAIVRNIYKEELEAAILIDSKFNFREKLYDFIMNFTLAKIRGDFSFIEKSISDIRKFRDNLIKELQNINAVPRIDPGGVTLLLLDRYFHDGKQKEYQYYFLYKELVNEPLANGLVFLTKVTNKIIHEYSGIKDLSYATMHCLLAFVLWFRDKIKNGFFDEKKKENEYWGEETHNPKDYAEYERYSAPQIVKLGQKGVKNYFYAGNVHLGNNKQRQMPRENMKVCIYSVVPEKEPFVKENALVYFYSTDWIEVR